MKRYYGRELGRIKIVTIIAFGCEASDGAKKRVNAAEPRHDIERAPRRAKKEKKCVKEGGEVV